MAADSFPCVFVWLAAAATLSVQIRGVNEAGGGRGQGGWKTSATPDFQTVSFKNCNPSRLFTALN